MFLPFLNTVYYMASSASGQDDPNRVVTRKKKFPRKPYNKSFIDQVCSVTMAVYWSCSFFCEFMDLDFVPSIDTQKKTNLANIQPS